MRVLLLGATGLLGKALVRHGVGAELVAVGSDRADLRDPAAIDRLFDAARPESVILAAAMTDVDGCERDPETARAINRDGAEHVARAARRHGAGLMFISTDYVFDGAASAPYEVDAPKAPINVYGRTKDEAELRVRLHVPDACIVRTSWLFGVGGRCFPETILRAAERQPELKVVNDQRGSPTYVDDLAAALASLTLGRARAIVHATNRGDCTWYEFACELLRQAGTTAHVLPISTAELARPAPRPRYSVLSPRTLTAHGITMPTWQDAVGRYLHQRTQGAIA